MIYFGDENYDLYNSIKGSITVESHSIGEDVADKIDLASAIQDALDERSGTIASTLTEAVAELIAERVEEATTETRLQFAASVGDAIMSLYEVLSALETARENLLNGDTPNSY